MVSHDVAHKIVGIIGNVFTLGLYLSPIPTFIKIKRKGSVEKFSALPYKTGMINCAFWLIYGVFYQHPNAFLLITVSSVGLLLQLLYLFIFFLYTDPIGRRNIGFVLSGTTFALFLFTITCMVSFYEDMADTRSLFIEFISCLVNIAMYASPLFIMFDVLDSRSVKYMPFTLSLALFLNAIIWTSYALIKFDIYAFVTNIFGLSSGALQLVLYGSYYFLGVKVSDENIEVEPV